MSDTSTATKPQTKTERMIAVMRDYDMTPAAIEALLVILEAQGQVDMDAIREATSF
jgi:N12 class adenine-specific DNA methylase